jgi:hypothetical protein
MVFYRVIMTLIMPKNCYLPILEVDFILGDHEVVIEVKSTGEAQSRHIGGLKAFAD